ncbi:uncharacterized protein LOC117107204 [Anneissia japonica]|uniref:uncharacterized protein LOC117107204 n=1 Tax=Anneissia japonica TaxID=1529436 RepID=UPI0014255BB4|nr:uncharacterized protein LOC117107204 [Anneissia japonica]
MPGSVHDARIFNLSPLSTKLRDGTLFRPESIVQIEGSAVPLMIIGNPAYPLLPNLMRPLIGRGNLNREKTLYNYKLSATRMTVEKAFGRLKGRWRLLLKENEHEITNLRSIVQTCCTWHNICEASNVAYPQALDEVVELDGPMEQIRRQQPTASGERIRDSLVRYFQNM